MISNETAIPTCISCSHGGNLVVIGFTDDKLRFLDVRIKGDDFIFELEGSHSNTIRSVRMSGDGVMCSSVSSDNTLRLWDISQRKCFRVYKHDSKSQNEQMQFHKDSVWCMDVSSNFQYVYTGGKDGSIFEVDLLTDRRKHLFSRD